MKVLITGIAGLLGSRLAEWLLIHHPEIEVYGIDDLSGGYMDNIPQWIIPNCYSANICGPIDYIFKKHKFDYVFHFAAYAAECLSPFIRTYNYNNNLVGTANVVNCCIRHNVKRLIFTSSIAVYGQLGHIFYEDMICTPKDPYGVAKLACEMDIRIAGEQHGLDWCILRPHNIIGRNQNIWDKYRNVAGIWMYNKLHGQPITIYGDGEQVRAFSIIDDMLEPIWNSAISPRASKEIINLGGTKEYTIKQLAEMMQKIVGGQDIVYLEPRHEVKFATPSFVKSMEILDYKEQVDLFDGLRDMWSWAKLQPDRKQMVWSEYELDKGIYEYWKNK